jgi:hypothetical protein
MDVSIPPNGQWTCSPYPSSHVFGKTACHNDHIFSNVGHLLDAKVNHPPQVHLKYKKHNLYHSNQEMQGYTVMILFLLPNNWLVMTKTNNKQEHEYFGVDSISE